MKRDVLIATYTNTYKAALHGSNDTVNSPTNKLAYNLSARLRRRVHSSNVSLHNFGDTSCSLHPI